MKAGSPKTYNTQNKKQFLNNKLSQKVYGELQEIEIDENINRSMHLARNHRDHTFKSIDASELKLMPTPKEQDEN
jgi:hypothetical protein